MGISICRDWGSLFFDLFLNNFFDFLDFFFYFRDREGIGMDVFFDI